MTKFISLLKVQFLSYFSLNNTLKSKGKQKAGKISGLVASAILYVVIFGFFGVTYSKMYARYSFKHMEEMGFERYCSAG